MAKLKILLFSVIVLSCEASSRAQTTFTQIFIVRHADREKTDDLNAAGIARADELKRTLSNTGIDSIFSTKFVRTKKTVTPLANALGQQVIPYDSNPQLLQRILSYSIGKTLLVSGHSNTVPQLISLCGCKPPFENIPDQQFDNLFLVIIEQHKIKKTMKSSCKLLHMKYGTVTD